LDLRSSSPVGGKAVRLAFDAGRLTSDTGVLVLADIERRLGIAERLTRCLTDPRSPERVHHTLAEMIRFRVLLIAAGYPDANDCDALRADPAFKMALGRAPESGRDLCSQPTMCRLENLPTVTALKRMMAAMVELFCDSFEQVPRELEEAALTDGGSSFQILRSIFIPAVVPAIVTVTLFAFVTSWNEFLGALVLLSRTSVFTLPLILASARAETSLGGTDWGMLQAGITVAMIPCIAIYLLLQKYYVSGFTQGALK
jgi:hypothetical protein